MNFDNLNYYNFIWSFVFVLIYTVFLVYILMSSFMIVFIDSYRRMIIQEGSHDSKSVRLHQQKDIEFKNFNSFLRWFLGWLPDSFLKKIGKGEDATYDEEDVVEDGDAEDKAINGSGDEEDHDNDRSAYWY